MNKLYIFCSIPFSGKTTLTKEITKNAKYTRVDLDEVKVEVLGEYVKDEEVSQSQWDQIYQEMYRKIELLLRNGNSVLQDAGNFTRYE